MSLSGDDLSFWIFVPLEGKVEVDEFELGGVVFVGIFGQNKILRFQISVNYVHFVTVLYGTENLREYLLRL